MVMSRLLPGVVLVTLVAVGWAASQRAAGPAEAGGSATVSVVPAAINADRAVTFQVDVAVADVTNLGAYVAELTYDPAVITPIIFANQGFLESTGRDPICLTSPKTSGLVRIACVSLGGEPGPSGSGLLASFIFATKCAGGTTDLTLTPDLADPGGFPIAFQSEDGSVSLSEEPCTSEPDGDLDGCTDAAEGGLNMATGGMRNDENFWDFFDTPDGSNDRDQSVAGTDFFRILQRFGATTDGTLDPLSMPPAAPAYHTAFDRGASSGPNAWNLTAADGSIAGTDFFAILAQFGHSCA
jgi:hypothetical protein